MTYYCALLPNLPQTEMTARISHAVHSGRYLMNTKAMRALIIMRYACWSRRGPFQWIQIIPTTPKFQIIRATVMQSMATLYVLKTSLKKKENNTDCICLKQWKQITDENFRISFEKFSCSMQWHKCKILSPMST